MLLQALLWHSDYYATPSESGWGRLILFGSPHPHHQQTMESKVPLAVVSINLDHHVGVLWLTLGLNFCYVVCYMCLSTTIVFCFKCNVGGTISQKTIVVLKHM